jgi:hypothetical protein
MSQITDEELDELELPDYDSEDFEELEEDDALLDSRNDYVGGMWKEYGYSSATAADRSQALVTAHQMVQTFIDTFAVSTRYTVGFSSKIKTAGTDFTGKVIEITSAPVYDQTLTAQQAGVILTGMAVHEASHDRYGKSTWAAAKRVFGDKSVPRTLSNILDDVRIERRFAEDYPGYAGVFRPTLDYVQAGATKKLGGLFKPKVYDPLNLAVCAIRYPTAADWSDPKVAAERDWWQAWADKWSKEDAPRRHVEALREGLRRVAICRAKKPKPLTGTENALRLKTGLESLPKTARRALRLSAQGKTGIEISIELGMSLVDTRTLLAMARLRLAEGAIQW